MRLLSVIKKSLREQSRDVLLLVLMLIFAPCFVVLYRLWLPSGSTTYGVLVLNYDSGAILADGTKLTAGEDILQLLEGVSYPNESPLLKVNQVTQKTEAERLLRNRDAAALLIIPVDLSISIRAVRNGQDSLFTPLIFVGDLTNPYYAIASIMANATVNQYLQNATGQAPQIQIIEEALGASAARTEFENYVPGLLIFAVMMLVFQAAMTLAREAESGTLRRLQMTNMTSFDLLGGISVVIILIGVIDIVLTFLVAWVLGYRSQGPLWVAILVGSVTCLSVIGTGLIVACYSKTVTQAFLIANFPLVLFMFFSGAVFPLPRVTLFTLGGHAFGLYDLLPPSHAVIALNKVLTLGAGIKDVTFELAALSILSILYFVIGVILFKRQHMNPQ